MRYTLFSKRHASLAVIAIAVRAPFLLLRSRQKASSRSHRVLGRTMSSRRSPPRGNSGGFAFNVVANPAAVLPAVLDEDLVGVEPGRQDARDVDPRHVGLHGGGVVPGHARRVVDLDPQRTKQAQIGAIAREGYHEVRGHGLPIAVRVTPHHDVVASDLDHAAAPAHRYPPLLHTL